MKVDRLNKAMAMGTKKAPEGSFVVHNEPDKGSAMTQLLDEMSVSPMILKDPIAMDAETLKMPRIALVETYFHDAEAG